MNAVRIVSAGSVALMVALAGCQSVQPISRAPVSVAPTGVDGDWIGQDRVAISTLRGGVFSSRSADTGEKLTEGTYSYKDRKTIDLNFYSLKSQKYTRASCLQVATDQMNCTLDDGTPQGTRFQLYRYSGVS